MSLQHQIPGELFLVNCLQKQLSFTLNNKQIKNGRLLLFKKSHFYIQIALLNEKNIRENFEIPFPFKIENYKQDGLLYYDYRVKSLNLETVPCLPTKVSSTFFNKILEISVLN